MTMILIDTNVLVYAHDRSEREKQRRALDYACCRGLPGDKSGDKATLRKRNLTGCAKSRVQPAWRCSASVHVREINTYSANITGLSQ